jgi:hypothetical protein
MEIAASAQRFLEIGPIDFAVVAIHGHDSESLIQKTWGIAFIRFDMGVSVTENAMVRRAKTANRQTIRGSPIENKKGFAVGFEQHPESLLCFRGDGVRPVSNNVSRT